MANIGNLKITAEDFATLSTLINDRLNWFTLSLPKEYKDEGLSEARFLFDVLYSVHHESRIPFMDGFYKYADDDHLESALRKIAQDYYGKGYWEAC